MKEYLHLYRTFAAGSFPSRHGNNYNRELHIFPGVVWNTCTMGLAALQMKETLKLKCSPNMLLDLHYTFY